MPLIGVPCINRPDLLAGFLDSIDEPTWRVLVIDNSGGEEVAAVARRAGAECIRMPTNLGVAASWNFIIRTAPAEPWWCIANADTVLGPGDLASLALEMQKPGPAWVGMNGDWRVFAINRECVDVIGLFDENFHPCYDEDADYEYRCRLAGVPWYSIPGRATHYGSAAIRSDPTYAARNSSTHASNNAYYHAKWGGPLRGGERFSSPFDRAGSVREWVLEVSRLRDNAW